MATFEVIRFLELLFSVSFKRSFLSSPSFLAFQTMIVEFLVLNLMSGENLVQNERLLFISIAPAHPIGESMKYRLL